MEPAPTDPPRLNGLGERLLAERTRWPCWLPVACGLGIAVYFALPAEPAIWTGPLVLALGCMALVAGAVRNRAALRWALFLMLAAALGFTAAQVRTAGLIQAQVTRDIGPTTLEGRVLEFEPYPDGGRVTVERVRIRGLAPDKTPDRVRVRMRSRDEAALAAIRPGAWIETTAVVRPPSPPVAPGTFDFQRHAFFEGLGGIGFTFGVPRVVARPDDAGGLGAWIADTRQALTRRVLDGARAPENSVAAALMTGERRLVPEDILQAFRDSGIAHLLAISGLHLGLIVATVFILTRAALALAPPLALRFPIKKIAALAAALAGIAYAVVAGGTVPTVRAAAMAVLVLIALSVDRRALTLRLVAVAAFVVLLSRPESLMGASFQMSFAAVVALVAFYETWRDGRFAGRTGDEKGITARVLGAACVYALGVAATTLVASAATAPFAMHHFNRIADYGLIANLVAVPVTALWVMPWALVAFCAMPLGLESWPLEAMSWGLAVVIGTARTVAGWPGAATALAAFPPWAFAFGVLGALWLCLWRGRWRWWGAAVVVPALAAGLAAARPPDVLVAHDGELVGVRDAEGGLLVSTLRRERFTRDAWLRHVGTEPGTARAWPAAGTARATVDLACDGEGCVFRAKGRTIVIARAPGALIEDCWRADAVIAPFEVRARCPSGIPVIDAGALARGGAHALRLDAGGIRIKAANRTRGTRPWVVGVRPPGP